MPSDLNLKHKTVLVASTDCKETEPIGPLKMSKEVDAKSAKKIRLTQNVKIVTFAFVSMKNATVLKHFMYEIRVRPGSDGVFFMRRI